MLFIKEHNTGHKIKTIIHYRLVPIDLLYNIVIRTK